MVEIKVGETYTSKSGDTKEVLYISPKGMIVYINSSGTEHTWSISDAQREWKELPKERVLIELFPCMTNYGGVFYADEHGFTPDFNMKSMNGSTTPLRRIPNMESMCIDGVTYEVVEGK